MHPKNSTTNPPRQQPATAALDIDEFTSVRAGASVLDALELSSAKLAEALKALNGCIEQEEGMSLGVIYLLENHLLGAKAMNDASASGLNKAQEACQ